MSVKIMTNDEIAAALFEQVATLTAQNDRMREALEPFAFLRSRLDFDRLDEGNIATVSVAGAGSSVVSFFVRDIIAARAALEAAE